MPHYKFTRIYRVEAESKAEAMEKLKKDAAEYLEYEAMTLVTTDRKGWSGTFKNQLTGK